mmetsp:Transcript_79921/g.247976  ORF Transcript_79921/g.247976 Transcript_79921/m.247976 type:complete len:234 (-) Transcript_79921:592-1293(-)
MHHHPAISAHLEGAPADPHALPPGRPTRTEIDEHHLRRRLIGTAKGVLAFLSCPFLAHLKAKGGKRRSALRSARDIRPRGAFDVVVLHHHVETAAGGLSQGIKQIHARGRHEAVEGTADLHRLHSLLGALAADARQRVLQLDDSPKAALPGVLAAAQCLEQPRACTKLQRPAGAAETGELVPRALREEGAVLGGLGAQREAVAEVSAKQVLLGEGVMPLGVHQHGIDQVWLLE